MSLQEAQRLAAVVSEASGQVAEVKQDGDFYLVSVSRGSGDGAETFTMYDEADWSWLRDRVTSPR